MAIGDNIKKLRKIYNLSQKDLAIIAGVSDKAVSSWEKGAKEPRMGVIQRIADHFNLTKSNIIEKNGLDNIGGPFAETWSKEKQKQWFDEQSPEFKAKVAEMAKYISNLISIPIYGEVRAGSCGLAFTDYLGTEMVEANDIKGCEAPYWLRVKGDSMQPNIIPGDLVLICQQFDLDYNGQLAVVIIDGEEGTLKRVHKNADYIELRADNPYYPTRKFSGPDMERIKIIGVVRQLKRKNP